MMATAHKAHVGHARLDAGQWKVVLIVLAVIGIIVVVGIALGAGIRIGSSGVDAVSEGVSKVTDKATEAIESTTDEITQASQEAKENKALQEVLKGREERFNSSISNYDLELITAEEALKRSNNSNNIAILIEDVQGIADDGLYYIFVGDIETENGKGSSGYFFSWKENGEWMVY